MNKIKCEFCNKEYPKKGIGTHIWRNHGKGKEHNPNINNHRKGKSSWNKGLNKNDERIKNIALKTSEKLKGVQKQKLSEETKKKISNSRIKYLMEHPDQVPYLINHSSKISYPEMIFKNALESAKIEGWEYNYQNGIYQYDFAFINLKIDVEIDGGTHLTEKVKKIDERRDKFSIDNGWKVIRFTAKRVKEDVISCIEELKILLR